MEADFSALSQAALAHMRAKLETLPFAGPAFFDFEQIAWHPPRWWLVRQLGAEAGARYPAPTLCAYCEAAITEGPLTIRQPSGWTAQFCEACQRDWWHVLGTMT